METLLEQIQFIGQTKVDTQGVRDFFKKEEHPKGTVLVREGQIAPKMYFIEKGIMRTFYYDKDKEVTSWFYVEDQFVSSWHSFYAQSASFENIELLEDSVLYSIGFSDYQALLQKDAAFGVFGRKLAEKFIVALDYFSKSYQFLSARDKYNLIYKTFPGIDQRVSLGMIASIMGVSRESLSRLRAGKL